MLRSTTTEAYVVTPFTQLGRRLRPGEPRRFESRIMALRKAEELSVTAAGVEVLAFSADKTVDYCSEPHRIAAFGEVPTME